jgi:endonuclease/exonuclease/phosphatase family metal-dependent hydrolase
VAGQRAGARGRGASLIRDLRDLPTNRRTRPARVRYPHRACRRRQLEDEETMEVVTVNTQGWSWCRQDDRNLDKAGALVEQAREGNWDVACLSELHNTGRTGGGVDGRGALDGRGATVAVEEFVFVMGDRSGIMLSPAAQQAWRATGCQRWGCEETGRIMALLLEVKGQQYAVVSVYAPDSGRGAEERRMFFDAAHAMRERLPYAAAQMWLGDWNSHIGRDLAGKWPGMGRFAMTSPTSGPGREFRQWLSAGAVDLDLVDSFHSMPGKRGTWMHQQRGVTRWFELDVMAASPLIRRRVGKVRCFALHFSDHYGKANKVSLVRA